VTYVGTWPLRVSNAAIHGKITLVFDLSLYLDQTLAQQ